MLIELILLVKAKTSCKAQYIVRMFLNIRLSPPLRQSQRDALLVLGFQCIL